jgi:CubicO group peptidase (beta-lactamase class C family)
MLKKYILGALVGTLLAPVVLAQDMPINNSEIDKIAGQALKVFETPGMSVGIIKDGKLIFAKGYGIADIQANTPVTPDTIFGIASHTKAYTTAALAILMDEGKLTWDDKVIDHIPEFRMYDPYVTREFTIRDLLTHRSGLDLGAGDLVMFPNAKATRADIIATLQHLKPVSSFRSKFDYDNLLYIVAGEVVTRASGMPWEDFVARRIFQPLKMDSCNAVREKLPATAPLAKPYMTVNGKLTLTAFQNSDPMSAAGAINCSLVDHAKWIALQLNEGKLPDGTPIFSEQRHREMWTPNTITSGTALKNGPYNSHFQAYGLGWVLSDVNGQLLVKHSGGLMGMVTYSHLLPEQEMAVIVFTNSMNGGAMVSMSNEILDAYLGVDNGNWIETLDTMLSQRKDAADKAVAQIAKNTVGGGTPPLALQAYAGTYKDAWYGDVTVDKKEDQLEISFGRSEQLHGTLKHFQNNTFIVYWDDRTLEADAYVRFSTSFEGSITGIKMKPVSALTDFSFDFQHLDLKRIE